MTKTNTDLFTERLAPDWNWLNITGTTKSVKTEFCKRLKDKLNILYFDFEDGTISYPGKFITVHDMNEFRTKFALASEYAVENFPDLVVLDPLDALEDMIIKDYMAEKNIENLGEIPYGQGWADIRNKLQSVILASLRLSPKLISITHIKLTILDESRKNISFLDMNLSGKTKAFVQKKADGHCIFKRIQNEESESVLDVSFDNSSPDELSFAGSRYKPFHEVKTPSELHNLIIKTTKGNK